MPTPEEITRHHDEGNVVYVGAHPTGYTLRIEEPDPTWAQRYGCWKPKSSRVSVIA